MQRNIGLHLHLHIVWCLEERCERTCGFAGNSLIWSTCIWSLDTYFNQSPIYHLYVFIFRNFIPSKILSSNVISHNFIFNAKAIFRSWEFYRSHPFAGNRQSVHIVNFPAGHTCSYRSSGHMMIYLVFPLFASLQFACCLYTPPLSPPPLFLQVFVMWCTASFCLIVTDLKNYCSYCTKNILAHT